MTVLTQAQATKILRNLGWRVRTTSEYHTVVKHFQRGWNLGPALEVDGVVGPGPDTSAALLLSESRRRAGKKTAFQALLLQRGRLPLWRPVRQLPTHLAEAQRVQDDGALPLQEW